ncbi:MAG: asparagine synthase-related protein [Pseudomonadota bacterium]
MTALIAGILRLDGAHVSERTVREMLEAMAPRSLPTTTAVCSDGPFAAGVIRIGEAYAAHDRSSAQSGDGAAIAADMVLYGDRTPVLSDLSALISRDRLRAVADLQGDFAIAHWTGSELLLIRDHLGVRPLQYVIKPGQFCAFASLPQALLQTGLAERVLDAEVLRTFPVAVCAPGERTYFQQIRSVLAGHALRVTKVGMSRTRRYWRLPLGRLMSARTDPDEIAEELRRFFDQAVRRRLPDTGPVAGHVSAGLDSSSVAVFAARALAVKARPFVGVGYHELADASGVKAIDELDRAACLEGAEPNLSIHGVTAAAPIEHLTTLDPDTLLTFSPKDLEEQALSIAARHGAQVMLSGWGGDEVVTWRSHGNLAELFWSGQWGALISALRTRSRRSGASVLSIVRSAILSESLPLPVRDLIRSRHTRETASWLTDIQAMVPPASREAMQHLPGRPTLADSRRERRGWLEHWYLPERLETFVQRGARHGVQYAFPMLDLDLLRFAVTIPSVLLKDSDGNRAIFRRAMKGILPDELRLNTVKMSPLPHETLRQSLAKADIINGLHAMRQSALVQRFVDIDGVAAYVQQIREPDEILAWIEEHTARGEQVTTYELYHLHVLRLAWYLHLHGTEAE